MPNLALACIESRACNGSVQQQPQPVALVGAQQSATQALRLKMASSVASKWGSLETWIEIGPRSGWLGTHQPQACSPPTTVWLLQLTRSIHQNRMRAPGTAGICACHFLRMQQVPDSGFQGRASKNRTARTPRQRFRHFSCRLHNFHAGSFIQPCSLRTKVSVRAWRRRGAQPGAPPNYIMPSARATGSGQKRDSCVSKGEQTR
jgi:hypothetical protein